MTLQEVIENTNFIQRRQVAELEKQLAEYKYRRVLMSEVDECRAMRGINRY